MILKLVQSYNILLNVRRSWIMRVEVLKAMEIIYIADFANCKVGFYVFTLCFLLSLLYAININHVNLIRPFMGNKLKSVLCVCLYFYCPNIQLFYNKYGPDLEQTQILSHILKKSLQ